MPLAAFGLVLVIGLSVSRVLLAVPESGSRLVALVVAVVILASGFIVAAQERIARAALIVLCSVALVAVVAAGIAGLATGERHFDRRGGVATAAASAPAVDISAAGTTSFDVTTLSFPANATVPLVFDNQTVGVPHNIGIYDRPGGKELFAGKIVTEPAKVTYDVPPLAAGTYAFHCDVHPNMAGTLTVAAAAAAAGSSASTGTTVAN
jgi:plastocyanin